MRRSELASSTTDFNSPGNEVVAKINFTKNQSKVDEQQYKEFPKSIFLSPCPDGVKLEKGSSNK